MDWIVNVIFYIAHYRTVPLMRSVHRVLLKPRRLKQATEAGDAEIWMAQIVAECVPDGRINQGERTTAARVELYLWHDEYRRRLAERRCCRSATWIGLGRMTVIPCFSLIMLLY